MTPNGSFGIGTRPTNNQLRSSSTFSIETLNLLEEGAHLKASLNVALSVALCLAGAWFGLLLGRTL